MADAGTVTMAELHTNSHSVKKVRFDWTTSGGGAADKQTVYTYTGAVQRVATVPGTGGVQPTNGYAVTLLDDDGIDVLYGNGAGRSNVTTEQILPANLGHIADSKLYLHVTGAGGAKSGTLIVYVR